MNDQRSAYEIPPTWLSWATGIACLVAILDMPYGYYQFLRLVVTAYTAYLSYAYFREGRGEVAWAFAFFALIYNPVFPIAMSKGVHAIFNVLAATAILGELHLIRSRESQSPSELTATCEQPLVGPNDRSDFAKFLAREVIIIGIAIAAIFAAIIIWDRSEMRQVEQQDNYTVAPPAE